jgi:hypothetical protein
MQTKTHSIYSNSSMWLWSSQNNHVYYLYFALTTDTFLHYHTPLSIITMSCVDWRWGKPAEKVLRPFKFWDTAGYNEPSFLFMSSPPSCSWVVFFLPNIRWLLYLFFCYKVKIKVKEGNQIHPWHIQKLNIEILL